jgi:hypothetical protein
LTWLILGVVCGYSQSSHAQVNSSEQISQTTEQHLARLNYLLAVDRLHYYSLALSDYLADHHQEILSQALRNLTPEDLYHRQWTQLRLNTPADWNAMLLEALIFQNPSFKNLKVEALNWNYNFFRNKLMEAFKAAAPKNSGSDILVTEYPVDLSRRTLPRIKRDKLLLDAERYISEKTTRAIFWDAAQTGKNFEFHLGTERDFQMRLLLEGREIVGEVKTRANNYNPIHLLLDPRTGVYSYAFTGISGEDRLSHLMGELRIISFEGKFCEPQNSVNVYGKPSEIHESTEKTLRELFGSLPKPDLVVIGQKGALEGVIENALVAEGLSKGALNPEVLKIKEIFEETGSYFSLTTKASLVRDAQNTGPDPESESSKVLDVELPSHEVTDVLLKTRAGEVKRWRLISNMWGDEVVPVARALKATGVHNVVYIGTAGALQGKGLKVGDVITPKITYTQSGKTLDLSEGTYGLDFVKKIPAVGQVQSPFEETQAWLKDWVSRVDAVELETGYLRENLGDQVNFQAYFLVSDIVGSESETLANASSDSGKRKNGQLRLLESLFKVQNIASAISIDQTILNNKLGLSFKSIYDKISELRTSRDPISKYQVAQLALRSGLTSEKDLEALLKKEPSFDRDQLIDRLTEISQALNYVQSQHPQIPIILVNSSDLLKGLWNPKRPLSLQLAIGKLSSEEAQRFLSKEWPLLERLQQHQISIDLIDLKLTDVSDAYTLTPDRPDFLVQRVNQEIYLNSGLFSEFDKSGGFRFKQIDEAPLILRCEEVFL